VRHDHASAGHQIITGFSFSTNELKEKGEKRTVYGPGLLHEGVVRANVRFALDDVEARAPYPLFAQRLRERVRVHERAARRVDEHGVLLHLAQKVGIDDVPRRVTAGREDEKDVARARELVLVDALYGVQAMLRRERGLEGGVAGRGRV